MTFTMLPAVDVADGTAVRLGVTEVPFRGGPFGRRLERQAAEVEGWARDTR